MLLKKQKNTNMNPLFTKRIAVSLKSVKGLIK